MKLTEYEHPFPYVIIEDIFKPKQWKEIVDELEWLKSGNVFQNTEKTGAAFDSSGNLMAKKTGLFLENLYHDTSFSKLHNNIHQIIPYIFDGRKSWYFRIHNFIDLMTSPLVSYYENTSYYKPHKDDSLYTFLFWYYKEPKSFDGGDLIFSEYGIKLEIKPNMAVIFPGIIEHEVTEITNCIDGMGRFAVSTFMIPPKFPQNQ